MKDLNILTVILIAGLILFTGINANAESTKDVEGKQNNSLTSGSWSFQFSIFDKLEISSFDKVIISSKYHLMNHTAIRFGISIKSPESNFNNSDYTASNRLSNSNNSAYNEPSYNDDGGRINLRVKIIRYLSISKSIKPYIGIGPIVSHYNKCNSIKTNNSTNWSYGADVVLGFEWFVLKNISLVSEHTLVTKYNNSECGNNKYDIGTKLGFSLYL